ncbi:hypothetical protein U0070_017348 [Myodes glareolus]|uniref:Small ribosomal subunit protein uS5 C-terminal domain-containing protein n=1 Tax=Myodes glareolus TaxID=447135 RepID=A0AAW0K393_MYOGA
MAKDLKIKFLEIYLFSLPGKKLAIIYFFLGQSLKDEVLKATPVQKQTRIGQRTRGTGVISALVSKKTLMMANIDDCCTSARGFTDTLSNFAISNT